MGVFSKSKPNPNSEQAEAEAAKVRSMSVLPFKATLFSDKLPGGAEVLVAKIGRTGFLAWTQTPLFRNDLCSLKTRLPVINEDVETKVIVFKCYDRYGLNKPGCDQAYPHLAELVWQKLSDAGAKSFQRFTYHIDPKTGVPLHPSEVISPVEKDEKGEKPE